MLFERVGTNNRWVADALLCTLQSVGDTRFSVKTPTSTDSMDGIFAQGLITAEYTQVGRL